MTRRPSLSDLARRYLAKEEPALDPGERAVLADIAARTPTSRDAGEIEQARATLGDRLADKVAAIGGSWAFIVGFCVVMIGWMLLNTDVLARFHDQFDPYPYVFLNLMLSTLAAIQAPIILMSQNRAGDRDRVAARHDFEVNLRAELEIMRLHEKIDALVARLDAAG